MHQWCPLIGENVLFTEPFCFLFKFGKIFKRNFQLELSETVDGILKRDANALCMSEKEGPLCKKP